MQNPSYRENVNPLTGSLELIHQLLYSGNWKFLEKLVDCNLTQRFRAR